MLAYRAATGAAFIAVDGYTPASVLAWRLPENVKLVGVDERWALTRLPPASIAGQSGLLLRDIRRTDPPDPLEWTVAEPIGRAERAGAPAGVFAVYRVVAGGGPVSGVELPHP
jgi:hypothetical protein